MEDENYLYATTAPPARRLALSFIERMTIAIAIAITSIVACLVLSLSYKN